MTSGGAAAPAPDACLGRRVRATRAMTTKPTAPAITRLRLRELFIVYLRNLALNPSSGAPRGHQQGAPMYLQIAPRRSPADINGGREVRSSLQTEYLFTSRALPEIGHKESLSK